MEKVYDKDGNWGWETKPGRCGAYCNPQMAQLIDSYIIEKLDRAIDVSIDTLTTNAVLSYNDVLDAANKLKTLYPKKIKCIKFKDSYFSKWNTCLKLFTNNNLWEEYSLYGIPYKVVKDSEISKDYVVVYNDGTEE